MTTLSTDFLRESQYGQVSVINNPFIKEGLENIYINYRGASVFSARPYWVARVTFRNGNTTGEQSTPQCAEYKEMMRHLEQIIQSIS